jgi:hypothetical protein
MQWNRNGIRGVKSAPRPSVMVALTDTNTATATPTLPELAEVQRAIRARDLDALLALRDAVTRYWTVAVEREQSMTEHDRDELHALKDAIAAGIGEMTSGTVALSDQRGRAFEDTLPARVENVKAALAATTMRTQHTGDTRHSERQQRPAADRLADAKRALGGRR